MSVLWLWGSLSMLDNASLHNLLLFCCILYLHFCIPPGNRFSSATAKRMIKCPVLVNGGGLALDLWQHHSLSEMTQISQRDLWADVGRPAALCRSRPLIGRLALKPRFLFLLRPNCVTPGLRANMAAHKLLAVEMTAGRAPTQWQVGRPTLGHRCLRLV